MGASGWSYFVPYQADLNQALEELRQQSFINGDYYTQLNFLTMMVESGVIQQMSPADQAEIQSQLEELRLEPQPQSIEEVLERNETDGAHSILDITAVADEPDFGVVQRLSDSDCEAIFGTPYPTHAMVELKKNELQTYNGRWSGVCVVVFEATRPAEIYFTGYSGD